MSRSQTPSTTDDLPIPAQPQPSVDIDGELQLAALRRQFADGEDDPVRFREWEIERRLGSGGMGTVYLARHRELGRQVALKLIKPGPSGDSKDRAVRLIREAQALARVDHENVLRIHRVDTASERAVIEMEFIDGPTMREWQAQPGRSWRAIVAAYADAGDGLAEIHRAGILHRDIKPDNLLLDHNERVKVADLGLAVAARAAREQAGRAGAVGEGSALERELTADGAWVGTPGYMAPEVLAGSGAREASDQFSLAASLYEAVYGVRPYLGDTPRELAVAMEAGRLSKPRDGRWRPRWLLRVLRRGLRFDPDLRYPSVAALVKALRWRLRLRGRIGFGGGSAALLFGASTAVWYAKPAPPDPCDEAGAELAAIWNAEVRDALRGEADPGAASALRLLEDTLDARAAAWVATSTQLCAVERSRAGDRSAADVELDARQRACLRHVRVNLEALVGELRVADGELARHYTEAAAAIEALPTCEERQQLLHWPLDGSDGDAAEAELARALALETAGRLPEAEALARRVAEASADTDLLLHAEALYRLGRILGFQRRDRVALATLDAARNVAFRIGHDELVCRATAFQAKLGARVMGDPGFASRELGLAQACVERVGARSPILRADLLEAHGLLAVAAGEPSAAIPWHEQALALRREHLGDDQLETIKSLHNLTNARAEADGSDAQWPELAGAYLRCVELRTRALGAAHPDVADVLADLGRQLWRRGDYEAARARLEQAERIYASAPGDYGRVRSWIHSLLASIAIEQGQLDVAANHLERSAELQATDTELSRPERERALWLHLDGALALQLQELERAADSARRASALYRRIDPRSEAAFDCVVTEIEASYALTDFRRIAVIVRDEGDDLIAYLRALPAEERGLSAWYIGEALLDQRRLPGAVAYLKIALDSFTATGASDYAAQLRAKIDAIEAELQRSNEGKQPEP